MRLTLTLLAALVALSACDHGGAKFAPVSPRVDPYVSTTEGGAVYRGDVNQPGHSLPGSAPDVTVVAVSEGASFASVGDTVYFEETKASLTNEARGTLVRQAAWLRQNGDYRAVVEGHTADPGTREFNLALGARRASSVREYLVASGVDARRIDTMSYGQERPAVICTSEAECLARNRRVTTRVIAVQAGV